MTESSTGLDENVAGLLCYVLGWLTGLVFLLVEKDSEFVKFHAMQSLVVFLGITVLSIALGFIPYIGWVISSIIGLIGLILWIVLMIKAYQGERWKVPVAGDFAEKNMHMAG
jgi:Predicted membrane protein